MDNGSSKKSELDDFWDIDMLVPRKMSSEERPRRSTDTVEITVSSVLEDMSADSVYRSDKLSAASEIKRYVGSELDAMRAAKEPELEYEPCDSLIHKVRIYGRSGQFRYYEGFCQRALELYNESRESAEHAPYFSYVPQYDQLNEKQLEFYLYFRTKAREGEFVEADGSYVLLYVYEIINLADRMDTEEGQKMLYLLWKNYGAKYPKLKSNLLEWIAHYSLIHRLPPPTDSDLRAIAQAATLKEFYVVRNGNDYTSYAEILLAFSSSYDYHASKFAVGENLPIFEKHIPYAVGLCIKRLSEGGALLSRLGFNDSILPIDAYAGALCSYRAKKKIEIEFCSFSRTNELRYMIGEIVKYSENKIRGYLGIKSRLSCYLFDDDTKSVLDAYFDGVLIKERRHKREEKRQEYDALYDLPRTPLSVGEARRIEEESWDTTKRLVEAFETECQTSETETVREAEREDIKEIKEEQAFSGDTDTSELCGALGELYSFALAVYNGDPDSQRKEAMRLGRLADSIVDSINEICAELYGDVLIEGDGDQRTVIEDYRGYFSTSSEE